MTGCRRFLHVLLAWLAIVAYVTPVTAHSTHRMQTPATMGVGHGCDGHDGQAAVSVPGPVTPAATDPGSDPSGDHKAGSMACCVAMCVPALPSPALTGLWTPAVHATSDRPILHGVVAALVTRLDRPPKFRVAPIG